MFLVLAPGLGLCIGLGFDTCGLGQALELPLG